MENDIQAQIAQLDSKFKKLYQQGDFEEAITYAKEICALCEQYHGANQINTLTSIENLASLYRNLLDYAQAELLYKQTLNIRQETLGMEHLDTAYSLNKLGLLYYDMGNFSSATPLFQQALKIREQKLGKQHIDSATSQNNLALIYDASGEYGLAEPLYLQALKFTQKVHGDQHTETAIILNNLASLYANTGNYKQAEIHCLKALKIRMQVLGEQHTDTARSLDSMAGIYHDMGKYADAEPLYKQALKICEAKFGEKHPDTAFKLNNLALLYLDKADYDHAESLFLRVLKIRQEILGDLHPETSTSFNNLAGLYKSKGDYTLAESLFRKALKIYLEVFGDHHPNTAKTLTNLAGLYQDMGDYIRAEPLFQQGLKIRQQSLGVKHPDTAISLSNLALLYYEKGDYEQSESLNLQALEILQEVLDTQHPDTANSLNNLAAIYLTMGDYDRAEQLFKQGLKIRKELLGDQHPVVADSSNNLAHLYMAKEDFAEAEMFNQQALEIKQKVFGKQHLYTSANYNNLAMIYHIIGNYGLAWSHYQKALKNTQDQLGDHIDTTFYLSNLAKLYHDMGNYKRALPLYQQALEITQDILGKNHLDYAHILHNLAGLYVAIDKFDLAQTLKLEAFKIENEIIGQFFKFANETQRSIYIKKTEYSLSIFLSLVYRYLADKPKAVSSALNLVLQRKAILFEALAIQRDTVFGGIYPELQSQFEALSQLRMQIAQKVLAGTGKGDAKTNTDLLIQWNNEKDLLESELARQIPEMRLNEKLNTTSLQTVAGKISESGTLIEYVRFDEFDFKALPSKDELRWKPARYIAFIIPASDPKAIKMIDLGEAALIDQLIAEFRKQFTEKKNQRDYGALSQTLISETHEQASVKLSEILFDPLRETLANNTRLLLSPDGDINLLPFEVLPAIEGGYLINHYEISYLSVGRDVVRFGEKSNRKLSAPLVLSDPDFDLGEHTFHDTVQYENSDSDVLLSMTESRSRTYLFDQVKFPFARLPGSSIEGELIGQLLGVKPWTDAAVLEGDLKKIRSPVILHLATHGFFLEDQENDPNQDALNVNLSNMDSDIDIQRFNVRGSKNPLLRSGLALAGVNTWKVNGNLPEAAEDGLLTAEDVTGLNLLDTELVVLSACDTGLGEVLVGEGVFGLRRSFFLAGAKALIMSLWKVPDLATAILMERLYQNLLEKHLPRDQALREAQRYLSKVTIGEIRKRWLNKQIIKALADGKLKAEDDLRQFSKQSDEVQPFQHPYYWGAFICQGDPSPLPSFDYT